MEMRGGRRSGMCAGGVEIGKILPWWSGGLEGGHVCGAVGLWRPMAWGGDFWFNGQGVICPSVSGQSSTPATLGTVQARGVALPALPNMSKDESPSRSGVGLSEMANEMYPEYETSIKSKELYLVTK